MSKQATECVPGPADLARAQGVFYLVAGAWPLLWMGSFERVFGPKPRWLARTVAGLLVSTGWAQLRADASPAGLAGARRIGVGTAATFLTVELLYVPRGRIPWTFLLDAAMEAAWLGAWARTDERARTRTKRAKRAKGRPRTCTKRAKGRPVRRR